MLRIQFNGISYTSPMPHIHFFFGGCLPCWISPEVDSDYSIAKAIQPEAVRKALEEALHSGAKVKGVMVVSPTYFGEVAQIGGKHQINIQILFLCLFSGQTTVFYHRAGTNMSFLQRTITGR